MYPFIFSVVESTYFYLSDSKHLDPNPTFYKEGQTESLSTRQTASKKQNMRIQRKIRFYKSI